jgi:hypothetical protein
MSVSLHGLPGSAEIFGVQCDIIFGRIKPKTSTSVVAALLASRRA